MLLISLVLNQVHSRKLVNIGLLIWISLGTYSLYDFKNYSFENKEATMALVDELVDREITHIYCEGGLLQWQIMFYSKEQVIARYYFPTDRYPAYIEAVEKEFKKQNKSIENVMQKHYKKFNIPKKHKI